MAHGGGSGSGWNPNAPGSFDGQRGSHNIHTLPSDEPSTEPRAVKVHLEPHPMRLQQTAWSVYCPWKPFRMPVPAGSIKQRSGNPLKYPAQSAKVHIEPVEAVVRVNPRIYEPVTVQPIEALATVRDEFNREQFIPLPPAMFRSRLWVPKWSADQQVPRMFAEKAGSMKLESDNVPFPEEDLPDTPVRTKRVINRKEVPGHLHTVRFPNGTREWTPTDKLEVVDRTGRKRLRGGPLQTLTLYPEPKQLFVPEHFVYPGPIPVESNMARARIQLHPERGEPDKVVQWLPYEQTHVYTPARVPLDQRLGLMQKIPDKYAAEAGTVRVYDPPPRPEEGPEEEEGSDDGAAGGQ